VARKNFKTNFPKKFLFQLGLIFIFVLSTKKYFFKIFSLVYNYNEYFLNCNAKKLSTDKNTNKNQNNDKWNKKIS
jgi:hypothetical protein